MKSVALLALVVFMVGCGSMETGVPERTGAIIYQTEEYAPSEQDVFNAKAVLAARVSELYPEISADEAQAAMGVYDITFSNERILCGANCQIFGHTDYNERTVWIYVSPVRNTIAKNSVVHELMHTILDAHFGNGSGPAHDGNSENGGPWVKATYTLISSINADLAAL